MSLIRDISVKPVHPKNGDKWQPLGKEIMVFRFGRWVPFVREESDDD